MTLHIMIMDNWTRNFFLSH